MQRWLSILVLSTLSCTLQTEEEKKFIPVMPEVGSDSISNIRFLGDVLRTKSLSSENLKFGPEFETDYTTDFGTLNFPDLDVFLTDPALTAVTNKFGATVVSMQNLPRRSGVVKSDLVPWSSWWYPKKDNWMFEAVGGSVLSKYDLLRQKRYERTRMGSPPGSAAAFERQNYDPKSLAWEGLCDAWALASISSPEPSRPISFMVNGTAATFKVSELKALLLKTYEAVDDSELEYYGQKFTGNFNGWIFPDLFPDQFHRFVESELFENKKAFIMDHDPGLEVWNTPVFKANYLIDSIPGSENSVFVRMWIYTAEPLRATDIEAVGTIEVVREYDYVLSGKKDGKGNLVVDSGYWVKGPDGTDSRKDHPDYVIRLKSKIARRSWNPEIDTAFVDEILAKSYSPNSNH